MNNRLMCDRLYFLIGSCCAASLPELRPGRPLETPPHRSVSSCPAPGRRARADTWWKTRLLIYLLPQVTATRQKYCYKNGWTLIFCFTLLLHYIYLITSVTCYCADYMISVLK